MNSYQDILRRAENELSIEELTQLGEELLIRAARKNGGNQHSITDLKGLGKEIWSGIDPDEFVAQERDTWDG